MTESTPDPWRPARPWQIVRADLDLQHVFIPQGSFRFEQVRDPKLGLGYRIVHSAQAPDPKCFGETFLRVAGKSHPTFEAAARRKTLPAYSTHSAGDYATITDNLVEFLNHDHEVRRLEGVMKVPCHAHGGAAAKDSLQGHPPMWIKTPLHVYQFDNVIDGNRPLILIRAPLSPLCPSNTDGTAVGLA